MYKMQTLIRERFGKDAGAILSYMKELKSKSLADSMRFVDSNVYSFEFEFIFENEKENKDYWLYIWRLKRNINLVNSYIMNILV
jgi:hypothetical protein